MKSSYNVYYINYLCSNYVLNVKNKSQFGESSYSKLDNSFMDMSS